MKHDSVRGHKLSMWISIHYVELGSMYKLDDNYLTDLQANTYDHVSVGSRNEALKN